ncbi:MAG: DUF4362 domain-containing protein [Gracilibacteraceae bacterium]|jgi:hypothetical protein|nr:DUF4362 domain-containing protein [Gracilibacteraceae bacterium]
MAIMAHKKHTRVAIIVSAVLIVAAIGTACALGAGSNSSGSTSRDLAHFGVNGFVLGDLPPDTRNLIPTDRYNDDYENNFEGVRFTTNEDTGVIRRMFIDVLESGVACSLDDSSMRTPWRRLSEIIGFFGEGKEGWQDREQGLRYVEYKQVSGRLSASVRFVYFDYDERRLVWVIAESSLPYGLLSAWTPLTDLPADYSKEQAIKDGVYVIHGAEIHNQRRVDAFYADALAGRAAFMRVMQYTIEGDPIITDYRYDGETYTVVYDSTRDKFGSGDISTLTYKHLLPTGLDSNGTAGYTLTHADFIGHLENGWIPSPSSAQSDNPNPPENPPAISVSANGKPLEWIVGINVWNGAIVDREENFMAFMEGKTIDDLPLVSVGETVTVDFGGYPPSAVILSESILNESGAPKWRTDELPKNYNIGMAGDIGKFTIEPNYATALSSNGADYAPGRTIKGYKLVCQWLKPDSGVNECEYAFVIRSDAAISMAQEESATQSAP